MLNVKKINLFLLASFVSCSTIKYHEIQPSSSSRAVASLELNLDDPGVTQKKIENLFNGILHGYILGQVFIEDFDKQLDRNARQALKSNTYSLLLATRVHVDQFEHDINELYIQLVLATALPGYSEEQKLNAQIALDTIGRMMKGIRADDSEIPENLKHLVLSNLHSKQDELFQDLQTIHDDPSISDDDEKIKDTIYKHLVSLRSSRLALQKEMRNYQVDHNVFKSTYKEVKRKTDFKELENKVKLLSKEIKEFTSELETEADKVGIYPSTGPNGTISGQGFPENVWSLTYDDGPAATTDQVIKNLTDRKIPATFFVLAKQASAYPGTLKKISEGQFNIASHSYSHAQLTKVGPVQLEKEIGESSKFISTKIGQPVKLFRLPYGAGVSVSRVRAKIAEHNLVHVFWNVDTLDWQDKNPLTIYKRALKQMNAIEKNAGIVLFHDIHPQSVKASTMLMDYFNEKKIKVCTVQDVVDRINNVGSNCN